MPRLTRKSLGHARIYTLFLHEEMTARDLFQRPDGYRAGCRGFGPHAPKLTSGFDHFPLQPSGCGGPCSFAGKNQKWKELNASIFLKVPRLRAIKESTLGVCIQLLLIEVNTSCRPRPSEGPRWAVQCAPCGRTPLPPVRPAHLPEAQHQSSRREHLGGLALVASHGAGRFVCAGC